MSDLEKAIREAEAAGDLPSIPEEEVAVDQDQEQSTESAGPSRQPDQEPEVLTVNFDQPTFQDQPGGNDEIVSLLRELIDVCRKGFGY